MRNDATHKGTRAQKSRSAPHRNAQPPCGRTQTRAPQTTRWPRARSVVVTLPVVGSALRPLAKGLIRGSLALGETAREVWAEAGEQLSDLYAEARAEYSRGSTAPAVATGAGLVTPEGQPVAGG